MINKIKENHPLGVRLLFAVVLCSSFLTILTTAVQLFFDYQADIKQISRGIDQIREGYYESLVNSVWDVDPVQARIVLDGVMQVPGVVYVETKVDEPSVSIALGDYLAKEKGLDKHLFELAYQVPNESIELGTLLVVISFEEAFDKLIDKVALILTANAMKTFLASLFILFVFQYLVTKHLAKLAEYAGSLSLTNLGEKLSLDRAYIGDDELQKVCDSINMMQENIQSEIAERTKVEEALKNSEERYRTYIRHSPEGVFIIDFNGAIIEVNDAAVKLTGYSEDELLTRKIPDLVAPEAKEHMKSAFIKLIRTGALSSEALCVRKDGSKYCITIEAVKISKNRLLGFCNDITERKRAEEALREAYDIINKSPVVVFLWRNETNWPVEFVTENVERVFGYKPDEFTSGKLLYSQIIHPDDFERVNDEVATFPDNEGVSEFVHKPYRIITSDGTARWFEDITFIRRDRKGVITHYQGIVWDIDERVKAEQEKESLEEQLRQSFKMEAMGTLAGGIAHDFNNILAAILGYADMAKDDVPESSTASFEIDEIIKAGNRAKELVKHILAFSRKSDSTRVPVKIDLIVQEALTLLRATIPSTIEIRQKIDSKSEHIMAIPTQVHQIMMNLCTNAAQSMDENGGVLQVSLDLQILTEKDLMHKPELKPGKYAKLSIKDSGPGIDPIFINRIFDPYFTTKEVGKGSGMGLAVVHGIVESHDAMITVENNPGKGVTFYVFFPVVDQLSLLEHKDTEILPFGSGNILMVDDEQSIADVMKRTIERFGYTVTSTTSSVEALDMFQNHEKKFDLLITDQTMPQLTGLELSKEVLAIKPDLPIILCTGFSTKVDPEKVNQLGVRALVMKPVQRVELAKAIREAMAVQ